MKLDRGKAEAAIGLIAAELGATLQNAAWAIYTTVNHNMIAAIEDVTINEGIDPRESYMISGGGATACHIGDMAWIVGIRRFTSKRTDTLLKSGLSGPRNAASGPSWWVMTYASC